MGGRNVAETGTGDKGVLAHVLWRGAGAIVVNKPAGLPTTGRTVDDPSCLQHQLAAALGRAVWAPHQLDAGTSGAVVFVDQRALVQRWQRTLRAPSTHKDYLAVVHSEPSFEKQLIEAPVGGKPARTLVRVLDARGGYALVQARLLTGRTHQVRVHLAHVGHPLVGERRYRQPPSEDFGRPALHAQRLRWRERGDDDGPAQDAERIVVAPLPDDLAELLTQLGLRPPRP
jgi:23S rRNA-/tRNA-specific pseudouridylate synthase